MPCLRIIPTNFTGEEPLDQIDFEEGLNDDDFIEDAAQSADDVSTELDYQIIADFSLVRQWRLQARRLR